MKVKVRRQRRALSCWRRLEPRIPGSQHVGKYGILSWTDGLSSRGEEKGFGRWGWREPGSPGEEESPQWGRQRRLWKMAAAPEGSWLGLRAEPTLGTVSREGTHWGHSFYINNKISLGLVAIVTVCVPGVAGTSKGGLTTMCVRKTHMWTAEVF